MKKIMVVLALGAIGAGFAAWAAPAPKKPAQAPGMTQAREAR